MMDLNLGDESGVEATREIVARRRTSVYSWSRWWDDDDTVFAAMCARRPRLPAQGRRAGRDQHALRAVAAGEVLLAPAIAANAWRCSPVHERGPDPFPSLTDP